LSETVVCPVLLRHAQTAVEHGGAALPQPVKWAMRFAANVMRQTASRV
jgi:ubiquinone biosynthesis monooxygenase Coq7